MDPTNLDIFAYTTDQKKLLSLLKQSKEKNGKKLCLMVAPSFVVDFDFLTFVPTLKTLGFDKVTELTFGAKITNENYQKFVKEHYAEYVFGKKKKDKNFQEKFISSVCPASVELIKNQFPQMKKYLLPFTSPMGAMAKVVKKSFPDHTIIFLAPCSAKKFESTKVLDKKGNKIIELTLTFTELKQIIAKEKPKMNIQREKTNSAGFDSFYNDFTKIYPLAGGLCGTLHHKGILKEEDLVAVDGVNNIRELFEKHSDKVFFDILFCQGGCIGGPGVASKMPIFWKKRKVITYSNFAKKEKMNGKQGLDKYTKGIDFSREI
jgi:iron only hydrogenase large subunit-like protein